MDVNPLEVPRVLGLSNRMMPKVIERIGNPDLRVYNDMQFRLACHRV